MKALRLISAIAFLVIGSAALSAQDTGAQESKKARLEKEIAQIDKQLKDNAASSASALASHDLMARKIRLRRDLVSSSDKEIAQYEAEIARCRSDISALQSRVDTLEQYYSRLVKAAYRNRDARVWYMYILASDNLSQAYRRFAYFRNLSADMKAQAVKLREAKAALEARTQELEGLVKAAEEVKTARKRDVASLEKEQKENDRLIQKLQKDRKKYESELAAKKKQVEQLNKEIQRIIANASVKASSTVKTEAETTLASEFARNKGRLPWPASGSVVGQYGQHNHSVYKDVKLPFNHGVDIAVEKNAKACCVFDGVVRQIAVIAGNNKCVLVQHGEYFTLYCKLKTVKVKSGDKVTTGQEIGTVDTINGESQLHFEIWKGQGSQDPQTWLR